MPKHLLTDRTIRAAKPGEKPYRLADGENLYLLVSPSGVKSWQYRFRLNGKPDTFTAGKFPAIELAAARKKAAWARAEVHEGRNPNTSKRVARVAESAAQAETFEKVAAAWMVDEPRRKKKHGRPGWTDDYLAEVEASLRNHLSDLNRLPVRDVTARTVAPVLRAIHRKSPHMLDKVHRRLRGIMDFAVEEGLIPHNPLPNRRPSVDRRHYPAVTDLESVGAILRSARAADPCKGIARAHVLCAFTAQRISEIVGATWDEVNFETATWSIPRQRMKRKDPERGPHEIPLPPALLAHLQEWREAAGNEAIYICPAPRNEKVPITPEGVEKFYRSVLNLGGKHSPHSWRSAFSTICREAGKDSDVIEAQLDHVIGTNSSIPYDRAKRLALRRELMGWYATTLVAARDGAAVLPMRAA